MSIVPRCTDSLETPTKLSVDIAREYLGNWVEGEYDYESVIALAVLLDRIASAPQPTERSEGTDDC